MFVFSLVFVAFVSGLFSHAQRTLKGSDAFGVDIEIFISDTEGLVNIGFHLRMF